MSLIQVMVLIAVLTTGSLVIQRVLNDQKLSANSVESRNAVETLHSLIYSTMQDQDHCNATLMLATSSNPPTASTTYALNSIRAQALPLPAPSEEVVRVLADGQPLDVDRIYIDHNVRIRSMSLRTQALSLPAFLTIEYERMNPSELTRTKVGYGGKNISKTIEIVIQRSGGTYKTCYARETGTAGNDQAMASFCNNLGDGVNSLFTWDPVNNVCQLRNNLCVNSLFAGIEDNGVAKCMPMDQWIDLDDILDSTGFDCDPNLADAVRFEQVGTKVHIRCQSAAPVCTPSPACPTATTIHANLSYVSESDGPSAWTTLPGHVAGSLTWQDGTTDPNFCFYDLRNSVSCNSSGLEVKRCTYSSSTNSGCGAVSCTPPPPCPAAGTIHADLAFVSVANASVQWTGLAGHNPGDITWQDGTTDPNFCYYDLRTSASCISSGMEVNRCVYSSSTASGCGGVSCTPVASCPTAASLGPTFTQDQNNVVASTWTSLAGHGAGVSTWQDGTTDPNFCYYDVRNANSCNGASETRRCRFANSAGTGCTAPAPTTIAWTPLTHDFGNVPGPLPSSWVSFTLTNTSGTVSATGCSAIAMAGDTTRFDTALNGTCAGSNVTMPPGSSCTVDVRSAPTVAPTALTLSRTCTVGGTASTTPSGIIAGSTPMTGTCQYNVGPQLPACMFDPWNEGPCNTISDCPAAPPQQTFCNWQSATLVSCDGGTCTPSCPGATDPANVCQGIVWDTGDGCGGPCTITGTNPNYAPSGLCMYPIGTECCPSTGAMINGASCSTGCPLGPSPGMCAPGPMCY